MTEQNPTPSPTRSERLNALMDDIDGFPGSISADSDPAQPETPPESDEENKPEPEEDDSESDENTGEGNNDDVPTPNPEPEPEPENDKITAKRLASIERAERRSKEAIAAERQELERERDRLRPQIEEAKQFTDLKSRARYDVAGVLASLGLTEEHFEAAARELYALSPAAQNNPKAREVAAKSQKEREQADRIAQLEKRLEETERKTLEREEMAMATKQVAAYIDAVVKSIGDEAPQ